MQLLKLRKTAFKFLELAALISTWWDVGDMLISRERGQTGLMIAQMAGIAGTAFTIAGTGMAAFGYGSAALLGFLGLVGAALAIGSVLFVMLLKEEDWANWLTDIPLNMERQGKVPIHKDLLDTMQKLANVKATLQPA